MYKNRETLIKELEAAHVERDAAMAHAKTVDDKASELQEQLAKLEQTQKLYDDVHECAVQLKTIQQAFIDAGFSDAQAFSLIQVMMQSALAPSAPIRPDVIIKALLK